MRNLPFWALATVALYSLLAFSDPGLSIRITPQVPLVGQSVWLTCRVTPDKRNRRLTYGIAGSGHEGSERQLDGYNARITWGPVEIRRIPCGAGPAYCLVDQQGEKKPLQATATIEVGGCEGTK